MEDDLLSLEMDDVARDVFLVPNAFLRHRSDLIGDRMETTLRYTILRWP